jgi:hypothetical protein
MSFFYFGTCSNSNHTVIGSTEGLELRTLIEISHEVLATSVE